MSNTHKILAILDYVVIIIYDINHTQNRNSLNKTAFLSKADCPQMHTACVCAVYKLTYSLTHSPGYISARVIQTAAKLSAHICKVKENEITLLCNKIKCKINYFPFYCI